MAIVSYEKKSENIINKILSECTELPKNIIFTANGNEIIRNFIKNSDELLYVRLDSDDIYEPTYFERLMNYEFKKQDTQAIISQDGYVYDINEKRLATYHYYSPPFYAFRYNVDEFMNGLRYKPKGGHMGVINLKNEVINGNNFCVIIHGNNNQSTFNRLRRYGKEIVNNKDIKFVLDKFNIEV